MTHKVFMVASFCSDKICPRYHLIIILFTFSFSWPYHGGDSSNVGVKRQRGSQRGLNKLGIGFNTNNHGPVNPATMRSNTTEGYYKPRQQVRIRFLHLITSDWINYRPVHKFFTCCMFIFSFGFLQLQKHALVSRTKSAPIPASKQRHAMLGMTHQGILILLRWHSKYKLCLHFGQRVSMYLTIVCYF